MNEVHNKFVHTLFLNEKSPYVNQKVENYDLFLSSATDNSIKMWDLRTDK